MVELALEAFLHDFHVQQAEEAAAEAEAQRLRHFRLVHQRGVVQLQFFQCESRSVVLVRSTGNRPAKTCGCTSLKPGSGSGAGDSPA
jgi:hypothetical protein